MKAYKIIYSLALILALTFTSCGNKQQSEDPSAYLDSYVELNNNEASKKAVIESGIFDDYKVYRDGYDIIADMVVIPAIDLSGFTEETFGWDKSSAMAPMIQEYNSDENKKKAFDFMKDHDGKFIYNYKDHNGNTLTYIIKAEEIK